MDARDDLGIDRAGVVLRDQAHHEAFVLGLLPSGRLVLHNGLLHDLPLPAPAKQTKKLALVLQRSARGTRQGDQRGRRARQVLRVDALDELRRLAEIVELDQSWIAK